MDEQRRKVGKRAALGIGLLLAAALWVLISEREPPPPDGPSLPIADLPSPSGSPAPPPPAAAGEIPGEAPPAELVAAGDAEASAPEDPWASAARCRLDPALPSAAGHLVVGSAAAPPYDGRLVRVSEGFAHLPLVDGAGEGVLAIEGYAPVPISWADGTDTLPARCSPDPVPLRTGETWLTGRVRNAEGEPEGKVFVEGCGNQASTDADGTYAMTVTPGRCVANAFRRDGLLTGHADPAEVEIAPGEEQVLDFELPVLPTAGLGLLIRSEPEGVRILDVLPGTAASDAELASGDLVTEVDGTPTAGLELSDFVELAVGPVGSEVQVLVVRQDGHTEQLTLDRRELTGG